MFGIGGGELIFIVLVVLMLFGSDKIPDIARTVGKTIHQLKNATNDIKSEIHKSADIDGIKKSFTEIGNDVKTDDISAGITKEIDKVKEDIEDMSGPIKRLH
jgi:sec-independent protein translocase protein TatA